MTTVNLIVKGKVQGVFFRAEAKENADKLGVKGWIKNQPDGNVEIMAKGSQEAIDAFIAWCRKGSKRAAVTDVIVTPLHLEDFGSFDIIR
ncbi:acylphosphatase [Panacibacter ginsenosidivorans]|uniref:acylphosphatase n=1 Tax=Panacibacter ginsenosidivorans TaxID=1813871 RepID=A0A5B8VBE4_9BACT|nr:acylphosphatase [Panacibacter ginsenosidivorans]QEC68764.1 acylphosphatase [Panacibacter ginsenosidivorans]